MLYCQHGIRDEAKGSAWSQEADGLFVRAVMMPCSSKIEVPYVLRILESGAEAVEIVACPEKSCKLLTQMGWPAVLKVSLASSVMLLPSTSFCSIL